MIYLRDGILFGLETSCQPCLLLKRVGHSLRLTGRGTLTSKRSERCLEFGMKRLTDALIDVPIFEFYILSSAPLQFCSPSFSYHSRLVLTAVLLTSKMFNDTYYTNRYIAEVGGVTLENMNDLEKYFMQVIDWNLNITTEDFALYEQSIDVFSPPQDTTKAIQSGALGSQMQPVASSPEPAKPDFV